MTDSHRSETNQGAGRAARAYELFLELIEVDADERSTALKRMCAGDEELRVAVQRLLDADRKSGRFLEPASLPALGLDGTAMADSIDSAIGKTVDGFVIESRLAEGGMGIVYLARQQQPARRVALKIVRQLTAVRDVAQRLVFESEILSLLRHPNVAQVYAAGTMAGPLGPVPYFAMELVEGAESITAFSRFRNLGVDDRLDLFRAACEAVGHGHSRGVIHRDLKPSNVLVDGAGTVKVIDFGIARLVSDECKQRTLATQTGALMGSLPYMAPEQCTGGASAADARSDVYALGAILYELLCDAPVFDVSTKTLEEALRAVREETPRTLHLSRPEIDRDLESVVLKALSKAPDDRYSSVAELTSDLQRYRRHQPVLASRPGAGRKFVLLIRRNPLAATLTMMIAVTLITATFASVTSYLRERRARQIADARRAEAESITEFIAETFASIDPAKARGSEPTVRELLRAALDEIDPELGHQPIAEARMRDVIGTTYYHLGNNAIAEEQLRASLTLTEDSLGDDSLEYANRAKTLAAVLWNRRQYEEAADLLRQALAARRLHLGREHDDTIDVASALATVLSDMKRNSEAVPLLREAIAAFRKRFPDGHPVLARSLNALGTIKLRQGDLKEADSMIGEAASMLEKHLGGDHPFTNITKLNYVNVLQDSGKHDEALRTLDVILANVRKLYGEEHVLVATCLEKQVTSLEALGSMKASAESASEAARIRKALSQRAERTEDRAADVGEDNETPSER